MTEGAECEVWNRVGKDRERNVRVGRGRGARASNTTETGQKASRKQVQITMVHVWNIQEEKEERER